MLTRATRRAVLPLVLGLLAAVALVGGLTPSPSSADTPTCTPPAVASWNGTGYSCTVPGGPGGPGGSGEPGGSGSGGGPSTPTCTLYGDYTYCMGTSPCRNVEWHPPMALPAGPKPSPDSEPRARMCGFADPNTQGPIGYQYYWSGTEPEPPSLQEQAQTAVGEIDPQLPEVITNPPGRTVVNVPTWYWLDGDSPELRGSSAFGLVAIATVSELRVDTGDGTVLTCPWTSSAAEAERSCTHTYTRDSSGGSASFEGRPAYQVEVTAEWSLRFEVGGTNVVIPGAPTTLDGPASTAVLRVDQVQSIVDGTD